MQESADKAFSLLRKNAHHPSLHFKPIGKFWTVRVGVAYRAIAIPDGEDYIWVWIGLHDEYDRLVRDR